jgi:hypothetical protein
MESANAPAVMERIRSDLIEIMNLRTFDGTTLNFKYVTKETVKLINNFRRVVVGLLAYQEFDDGKIVHFKFKTKQGLDDALKYVPLCNSCDRVFFIAAGKPNRKVKCPHCEAVNIL